MVGPLKTSEVCITTSSSGHAEGCREPKDKSHRADSPPSSIPSPILFESHHPHLKPSKSLGRILTPWPSLPSLAILCTPCPPHPWLSFSLVPFVKGLPKVLPQAHHSGLTLFSAPLQTTLPASCIQPLAGSWMHGVGQVSRKAQGNTLRSF